jgi:lysophospholipase L1-like esterase
MVVPMSKVPRIAIGLWLAMAAAGVIGLGSGTSAASTIRIVTLGDSTTASYQDWAPEIRRVYSDCLPGALAASGIAAVVVNAGIGDTTTRQAVDRLDHDVRRHHPDLVVVQFGINDSWIDVDLGKTLPRLSRAQFRANLRTIIRRLGRDGARIVLMTPNPMRWGDPFYVKAFTEHPGLLDVTAVRGIDKLLDVYAQDVREVAKGESVALVDIFEAFEHYGAVPGQSIDDLLLASDRIHPNQAGQDLVCMLLAARIAQVLAPESSSRRGQLSLE